MKNASNNMALAYISFIIIFSSVSGFREYLVVVLIPVEEVVFSLSLSHNMIIFADYIRFGSVKATDFMKFLATITSRKWHEAIVHNKIKLFECEL